MQEFFIKPFLNFTKKPFLSICSLEEFARMDPEIFSAEKMELYIVHFYLKGKGIYRIGDESVDIDGKAILFTTYLRIKQFCPGDDCEGYVLIFSESFFGKTTIKSFFLHHTQLFNSSEKVVHFAADERFEELSCLFGLIADGLERPYSELQEQILLNYVFSILLIGEEFGKQGKPPLKIDNDKRIVRDFKLLVNEELNRRHSLQYFSRKLNISLAALDKAFKKHENITPKKWLNRRLVTEIKIELNRSDISIGEIAFKFGFSEVTNFTKFFKTLTGTTPKQYRQRMNEG